VPVEAVEKVSNVTAANNTSIKVIPADDAVSADNSPKIESAVPLKTKKES
jgi:hypothetical protein